MTSYFMAKASGRKRKNRILSLEQDDVMIQGDNDILLFATSYYNSLFGPSASVFNVSLEIPIECALDDLNRAFLEQEFTLDEIRVSLFQMKHNKAAGPDGLPAEFYQHFWHMLKNDVLMLFNEFYHVRINTARLNIEFNCSGLFV
uniref:Uncharacterized protein n=1 Tax=Avena sativa TaxID=4498 RepID=A0ACD5TF06_AVESA